MGFIKDLRFLLRRLPPFDRRQSMLFSATLNYDVMELAYVFMNDAVRVAVTPEQVTAENVDHRVYHVGSHEKLPLLVGILRREGEGRVLIFVNMRRSAERVARVLEANGIAAAAITGDVEQRRRLRILDDFKQGRLPVLIATDVASRGLHIEGVTHVINYDLPFDPEDYVHRVGRTARAGASGRAYSLACEEYVEGLEAIERFIGFKLPFEIADEHMLVHQLHHPPRERRPRGPGDVRRGHAKPAAQPAHAAAHAPAAPQPHAPGRRRRRRRRPGPPPPA
jgi:ATP-dependent RNA helicase RhlB